MNEEFENLTREAQLLTLEKVREHLVDMAEAKSKYIELIEEYGLDVYRIHDISLTKVWSDLDNLEKNIAN